MGMAFYFSFFFLFILERIGGIRHVALAFFRKPLLMDLIYFFQNNGIKALMGRVFLGAISFNLFSFKAPVLINKYVVFVCVFLVADFSIFAGHKLLHFFAGTWKAHKTHHTITFFDSLAAFRFHGLEQLMYSALYFVYFYFFIIRLGWPMAPFLIAYTITSIWEIVIHSNIKLKSSNPVVGCLRLFLILPDSHRLHHMEAYKEKNFGNLLSIWDRLWRTYLDPAEAGVYELGLPNGQEFSESYKQQALLPFRI